MSAPAPVVMLSNTALAGLRPVLEAKGWRGVLRDDATPDDLTRVVAIVHSGQSYLDAGFLAGFPRLGLVANVGVGYDGLDLDWCRAEGIAVTHAVAVNAEDVADHAMGLILTAWRNIALGDRAVRDGQWAHGARVPASPSLTGRRLGVVGLGAIGEAVASRAAAFGLQVAWWGPRPRPEPWSSSRADSLRDLAVASDILVVACRADASTTGLISQEIIEAVGPKGLLVNVARGAVVDEDALIAALRSGRLGRAALDVFHDEPTPASRWADVPNVVLTPHTAGATQASIPALLDQAVASVELYILGQPVPNIAEGLGVLKPFGREITGGAADEHARRL